MPRPTARSIRLALAGVLLLPVASPLIAQDAFSALAGKLTEARTSSRAGDHARAIPLVDSLYTVLPGYPNMALLRGAAMARAGRDAEAIAMLRRLLAWDPRYARVLVDDSSFAALRGRVAELDIPRRADLAGAPVARAQVLGVIEERDFVPEGSAYDPQSRSVLVGSIYKGKVVAIGPDGRVRELIPRGTQGLVSVAGIHVDPRRQTLWVAGNARFDIASDTTSPALYAFDVSTGAFRARYAVPPGRHFLNDVTTMPDGTVYLSDSRAGRVWRLSPGAAALEPVAAFGPLLSPNGITTDGRRVFVSDIDHIRVFAPESGESWRLSVPDSIDVSGIDGLAWADGSLIAHHWGVAASRIARYPLDAARRAIAGRVLLEANTPDVRTSTTGEVAGSDYVFIGNSQLDRMNARTVDSATMQPVRIYRAPLTPVADGLVAVALSARDSVVLLDPGTLERVATLRVGNDPHEIAASPDGRRAFVADAGDTTITVLDIGESPRVATTWALPDSTRVHDVAVSADGRSVWAASAPRRLVLRIDAASGRVLRRYPLTRDGAWMLESGPDGQIVVSHLEGGALAVLDAASGRERVLPLAAGEIDGTFTPDGRELWSVNLTNNALTVLDPRTGAVIATDRSGAKPVRVIITPDGATALMVSEGDSSIVAFDTRTKLRLGAATVAAGPKVIALSRDGRRAYVSHPERGLVTLLDVPSLTVMRTAAVPGAPDGVAVLQAERQGWTFPSGLVIDTAGNILVADRGAHRVFRIDGATGAVSTIIGTGEPGSSGDGGPAHLAMVRNPEWLVLDRQGNLLLADRGNYRVRRIDARTGNISTIAGTGRMGHSGDGGPAVAASITHPFGLTLDARGNLYIFDTEVHVIRRVDAGTGIITTVVGNTTRGFAGDGGPGTGAMLARPHNGVMAPNGDLIFGDSFNQRIRRWNPTTGIITTIAGVGEEGVSPDGTPADQARFTYFGAMVIDRNGNLIFTSLDHRIVMLEAATRRIKVVAGTGQAGFAGDGGPALAAQLNAPYGLAIARNGDLVFADAANRRIRRIDLRTGVIRTIAGP